MSFFYADGYLPFCPSRRDVEGNPYVLWDGVTYTAEIQPPPFHAFGAASRYPDRMIPVVGPGTLYPFGLSIEEMSYLYWRAKKIKIAFADTITVSSPSLSKTGYWKNIDGEWVSETYTIDEVSVSLPVEDLIREISLSPAGAASSALVCSAYVSGGHWLGHSDSDSHNRAGAGGSVGNSVYLVLSLDFDIHLSSVLYCDDKYWPHFSVIAGINIDPFLYSENALSTGHGWDVGKEGGGRDQGGESKSTTFMIGPYCGLNVETKAWPIRLMLDGSSLESHVQLLRYQTDTYPLPSLPVIVFTVTETRDL